jgi:hypothetical protein
LYTRNPNNPKSVVFLKPEKTNAGVLDGKLLTLKKCAKCSGVLRRRESGQVRTLPERGWEKKYDEAQENRINVQVPPEKETPLIRDYGILFGRSTAEVVIYSILAALLLVSTPI